MNFTISSGFSAMKSAPAEVSSSIDLNPQRHPIDLTPAFLPVFISMLVSPIIIASEGAILISLKMAFNIAGSGLTGLASDLPYTASKVSFPK